MPEGIDDYEFSEGLDPDGPSAEDLDRFGGETIACPHCGAEAWDQARECRACGRPLDEKPEGSPPVPMWAWITLFIAILAVLFFFGI